MPIKTIEQAEELCQQTLNIAKTYLGEIDFGGLKELGLGEINAHVYKGPSKISRAELLEGIKNMEEGKYSEAYENYILLREARENISPAERGKLEAMIETLGSTLEKWAENFESALARDLSTLD